MYLLNEEKPVRLIPYEVPDIGEPVPVAFIAEDGSRWMKSQD